MLFPMEQFLVYFPFHAAYSIIPHGSHQAENTHLRGCGKCVSLHICAGMEKAVHYTFARACDQRLVALPPAPEAHLCDPKTYRNLLLGRNANIIAKYSHFVNCPKGIKTHFMQFHALAPNPPAPRNFTLLPMWECCQLPMLPITNVANYQLDIGHWHWQHWKLATFPCTMRPP